MVVNFYDTSALMLLDELYSGLTIVSPVVLTELEQIKTSKDKDEKQKFQARRATKLLQKNGFKCANTPLKTIKKITKKYPFLLNINDHKILCEAISEKEKFFKDDSFNFLTADLLLSYFGSQIPNLEIRFLEEEKEEKEISYYGWEEYQFINDNLASIYSNPNENILKAKNNEFCVLKEGNDIKDILFWNGEKYTKLKYKEMKNPYTNEIIHPKNIQQKMAFHMLQNQDIKVKTIYSAWGGGKTLLALTYALEQISKGNYQKLIFVRNNIVAADTNDIGFLPGTIAEKTKIWGMCMAAHVGGEMMLEQLIEEGIIEIFPLSHMRGLSIRDSIVLADECENLTTKHITLLLSRIEANSEIIFCGDMAQVDFKKGSKYSGMNHMINTLAGDPLFGVVKLIKSERGPVPLLCDKLSPPNI